MADSNSNCRAHNFVDLTGKRFGKWTVLGEAAKHPSRSNVFWTCICECGTQKLVNGSQLTRNLSHGCRPCVRRRHGMHDTTEYNSWEGMKQRCNNPNAKAFPSYGGNDIAICDRWKSFENFYADMGVKPSAFHSIDRIDGSKGYYCGHCEECVSNGWTANCRWATRAEQTLNRSCVRMITFNGETLCLTHWAVKVGIHINSLRKRLRLGWSVERALTEPVKGKS
jgi:hypothetical protein